MATSAVKTPKGECLELAHVLAEEIGRLAPLSDSEKDTLAKKDLAEIFQSLHSYDLKALCFSGGGIRSATFGLGVIQSLAKHGLLSRFDYLSTVSGGGYLGSWLSAWIRVELLNNVEHRVSDLIVEGHCTTISKDKCADIVAKSLEPGEQPVIGANNPVYRELEKTKTAQGTELTQEFDRRKADQESKLGRDDLLQINDEVAEQLFKMTDASRSGVEVVEKCLRQHSVSGRRSPNTEPAAIRHLREYSNYMTPKVGVLSADTWAFVGIYLRNLFLNWTIFVPLIAALLLVPRILYKLTDLSKYADSSLTGLIYLTGLIAGSLAITFVIDKLPSKNKIGVKTDLDTDGWVLALGVVPMIAFALAMTTIWAGAFLSKHTPVEPYSELTDQLLVFEPLKYVIFTLPVLVVGFLLYLARRRFSEWDSSSFPMAVAALVSSIVGGLILGFSASIFRIDIFPQTSWLERHIVETLTCISLPAFLLIFLIQSTIFVGLASKWTTDDDREWLARYGGWILIFCGIWAIGNGLVLIGPLGVRWMFSNSGGLLSASFIKAVTSIVGVVSGVISLVGGFSSKLPIKTTTETKKRYRILSVLPQIASVVFSIFIVVGIAYLSAIVLSSTATSLGADFPRLSTTVFDSPPPDGAASLEMVNYLSLGYLLLWAVGLGIIGFVMACFVNVNKFSLHGAYRDRLVRAYLGASNLNRCPNMFTGFDDKDNRQLHRLKRQRPLHIINATLNLISNDNLAWQTRKAASFTMSGLHCGSWLLGYRRSYEYARNESKGDCGQLRFCNRPDVPCGDISKCEYPGSSIRLGTAMAISGAAADPNMGYYSSSIVTFLLALFNVRLGWWLGNPGEKGSEYDGLIFRQDGWICRNMPWLWKAFNKIQPSRPFFEKSNPTVAVFPLLNETMGRTSKDKRFLNVTDGGHFENLGLYEMVLRRCKFIVLSDAAADEGFKFGDLSNAIEKCRVDLGVEIRFRKPFNIYSRYSTDEEKKEGQRFAVADIVYPESKQGGNGSSRGILLYFRPTLNGEEPISITHYADANSAFPHQSTGDQFFDEHQFEAYRSLGFITFEEILKHHHSSDMESLMENIAM